MVFMLSMSKITRLVFFLFSLARGIIFSTPSSSTSNLGKWALKMKKRESRKRDENSQETFCLLVPIEILLYLIPRLL